MDPLDLTFTWATPRPSERRGIGIYKRKDNHALKHRGLTWLVRLPRGWRRSLVGHGDPPCQVSWDGSKVVSNKFEMRLDELEMRWGGNEENSWFYTTCLPILTKWFPALPCIDGPQQWPSRCSVLSPWHVCYCWDRGWCLSHLFGWHGSYWWGFLLGLLHTSGTLFTLQAYNWSLQLW